MELKYFTEHLSYYLPPGELKENKDFAEWLRSTPNLSYQFVTEIEYNLPAPRHSHYQDEFAIMRKHIGQYMSSVE